MCFHVGHRSDAGTFDQVSRIDAGSFTQVSRAEADEMSRSIVCNFPCVSTAEELKEAIQGLPPGGPGEILLCPATRSNPLELSEIIDFENAPETEKIDLTIGCCGQSVPDDLEETPSLSPKCGIEIKGSVGGFIQGDGIKSLTFANIIFTQSSDGNTITTIGNPIISNEEVPTGTNVFPLKIYNTKFDGLRVGTSIDSAIIYSKIIAESGEGTDDPILGIYQ